MVSPTVRARRSFCYRLLVKTVVIVQVLSLFLVSGVNGPVALADNGEPPLSVTIDEPPIPASAPLAAEPPPPIVALPADAPLIDVPAATPATPAPPPGYRPGPVPFRLGLSVSPARAELGDIITYTLVITNAQATALTDLEVMVSPGRALRWAGGDGLPGALTATGGVITAAVPYVAPRATLRLAYRAVVRGVGSGPQVLQSVSVGLRSQGVMTTTSVGVAVPRVDARAVPHPTPPGPLSPLL